MRPNGQPDKKSPMLPEDMRRLLDTELSRRGLGHFEVYQCGPTLDQAQIVSNYPEAMEPSDTADDFYRRGELVSLTRTRINHFSGVMNTC